jgi:hypothetical protein
LLAAQRAGGGVGLVALDLVPLDRTAAEALLESVRAPADRERCFAQSGGNPLLLVELARNAGRDAVPGGIVAAVSREVSALPGDARALVQAAAVAGDPFDLDLAARMAALDEVTALPALDALAERELVHAIADPRRFTFRHPVVRSAIYEALGAGERLAGHAAAASSLAAMGRPLTDRAHHLAHAARPGDDAAAAVLRAAAAEVRAQAPGVAADWLLAAQRAEPAAVEPAVLAETLVEAGRPVAALDVVDGAGHTGADTRLAVTGASIERTLGRHDAAQRRLLRALDARLRPTVQRRRACASIWPSAHTSVATMPRC